MEAYAPLFGFVGTCFVSVINFSPIPGFINLWKTKDLNLVSHTFFILCSINSVLWLSMGIATNTEDITRSNTIALAFNCVYLLVFHTVKGDLLTFIPVFAMLMSGLLYGLVHYVTADYITMMAGINNTLMVLAPLEQLRHVFRTKDCKYIDMYIMSLALPCSFCWMMFGVCLKMWAMIIPNFIGTMSCSILIAMFFAYRKPKKLEEPETTEKAPMKTAAKSD